MLFYAASGNFVFFAFFVVSYDCIKVGRFFSIPLSGASAPSSMSSRRLLLAPVTKASGPRLPGSTLRAASSQLSPEFQRRIGPNPNHILMSPSTSVSPMRIDLRPAEQAANREAFVTSVHKTIMRRQGSNVVCTFAFYASLTYSHVRALWLGHSPTSTIPRLQSEKVLTRFLPLPQRQIAIWLHQQRKKARGQRRSSPLPLPTQAFVQ